MTTLSTGASSPLGFGFRGRNPDVLTCIANLSNDEVFTPPDLASLMLDELEETWRSRYGGNVWGDPKAKFLDPFTKSGVFLREITKRLIDGLAEEIPDLGDRVDHILTKQVYGIAVTELTALVARRSLYCSKWANGEHSVASSFTTPEGNIWFERTEHSWEAGREWVLTADADGNEVKRFLDGKCKYCRANQKDYERDGSLESYAYAFIHTDQVESRLADLFGEKMKFDVVIGNPPYQLGQSGGEAIGSFAMPVYQRFVSAAKDLDPSFAVMVTPSRWFAGGRGLDDFRQEMLADRRLRTLVDYPDSREIFPGVDIAGGASYFLWDSGWDGPCTVKTVRNGVVGPSMDRYLDEHDILVRYNEAISILHKVIGSRAAGEFDSLAPGVSPFQPFGLRTKFRGATMADGLDDPVIVYQNGGTGFVTRSEIPRNADWVDQWTVFLSKASSEHGGQADKNGMRKVFSRIMVGGPGTACTETYLVAGRFQRESEARNFAAYLRTRFVRFLVSLRTNTQDIYSERFAFVPDLPMNREYSDEELYLMYALDDGERSVIESSIRPMEAVYG